MTHFPFCALRVDEDLLRCFESGLRGCGAVSIACHLRVAVLLRESLRLLSRRIHLVGCVGWSELLSLGWSTRVGLSSARAWLAMLWWGMWRVVVLRFKPGELSPSLKLELGGGEDSR